MEHFVKMLLNFNFIEVMATALLSMFFTTWSQMSSFNRIEQTAEQVKTELTGELRGQNQILLQQIQQMKDKK
jgi:hypothetical protein